MDKAEALKTDDFYWKPDVRYPRPRTRLEALRIITHQRMRELREKPVSVRVNGVAVPKLDLTKVESYE